jgi:hypothetical protein
MSNDDRLVPRDYPIPVSVRRPLGTALDPVAQPQQPAPPAAPAPHIIYIHNAAASVPAPAVPPPAAPPPQVIHHYHTAPQPTHNISFRIPRAQAHSALGMASMALGIVACVVCWVPWLGLVAVPVGTIGAVLGILGTVVSLVFRKSSAGLPAAGVFVCCLAAGISIASTRTLPYWQRQMQNGLSTVLPQLIPPSHIPAAVKPPPPVPLPLPTVSLFDPVPATPAPPAAVPQPTAPPASVAKPAASANVPGKLDPKISAARDQLATAQRACDQRTMQTPDYQAAVKAAADARAREAQLRQSLPSGSSDVLQASQDMIKADNALSDLLAQAEANDQSVISARQALTAARTPAAP